MYIYFEAENLEKLLQTLHLLFIYAKSTAGIGFI